MGLTLVPGMEISTKLHGAGVHLLAYLPDPTYPPLAAELDLILEGREGRLGAILDQLHEAGVDITEEEVRLRVGDAPAIGRPHVADVMVAKGIVKDRDRSLRPLAQLGPARVTSSAMRRRRRDDPAGRRGRRRECDRAPVGPGQSSGPRLFDNSTN